MGSPAEVWSTLTRVWKVSPSPEQIVADVMALPAVLDKIIEVDGCVVPDEDFRGGCRATQGDDLSHVEPRVRKRQRVSTHTHLELHPDCASALTKLELGAVLDEVGPMEDEEDVHADDDAAMVPPE